ncbi:uncharacterized protein TNCV_4663741 [Trichonephila clavipes]|uniref:Uncharacterized protein n=1 Tax=Trichonephila clavipes TaxID=2585209 RepID=A0A8X6VE15_TRICX|nr:uncharacterized protein TNCV_4663741 [Trichonephila clavipes]
MICFEQRQRKEEAALYCSFEGRKLITPFSEISEGIRRNGFVVGDIERLFEETRRSTKAKHEKWEKYYNRRRRDVQIKVRIYRHRKCDETEIGTGSSDNGSLRDESSGFDRVQRRSNESRDGKNKGSEVKRELEEKGLSFRNDHERKTEGGRDGNTHHNRLQSETKKREKRGVPTDHRERKTQQGGPVRSRKGRERNDSPYIEERTRSSNKNARRGGYQQRQDQERRGTCTKKTLSLEVLVGNANYKS